MTDTPKSNDISTPHNDLLSDMPPSGAASQVLQSVNDVSKQSELIRSGFEGFLSEIRIIQHNAG